MSRYLSGYIEISIQQIVQGKTGDDLLGTDEDLPNQTDVRPYGGIAGGVHLFPFRTEKLSPPWPMVLHNNAGEQVAAIFIKKAFQK